MFSLIRVFPLCSDSGGFLSHRWLGDYQNHNSTSAHCGGGGCLYLLFSSYNSSSVAVVVPDFRQRKCLISSSYFLPLPLALLIFSFFISWRQLCLTWLFLFLSFFFLLFSVSSLFRSLSFSRCSSTAFSLAVLTPWLQPSHIISVMSPVRR